MFNGNEARPLNRGAAEIAGVGLMLQSGASRLLLIPCIIVDVTREEQQLYP